MSGSAKDEQDSVAGAAEARPTRAALAARFARVQDLCAGGEFDAAERSCREILKIAPGHPRAIRMLAETLLWRGRHDDAIALLTPLCEQYPDSGSAQFRLGNALNAAGRYEEAARRLRLTVALQPQFAAGHCDLGLALDKSGDSAGAILEYERALALAPNLAAARANLGAALAKTGRQRDAVLHLRIASQVYPESVDIHLLLADALSKTGEEAEALAFYKRAVTLDERSVGGWTGLGDTLRVLGRFAEAIKAFERALAIDPNAKAALYKLTTIQRGGDDAEIKRLRSLSTSPDRGADVSGMSEMALAQLLEDDGRYDEAFAAATEGNRLARAAQEAKYIRYDHEALCASVNALMRVFTPEFLTATRNWGNPSELPVFIVGHFRTGSTLVEQICASHSQVHAVGESNEIPQIATLIHRTEPRPDHWTPGMFRELAEHHLKNLSTGAHGKLRVVDKMLDNIFHLGLIAVLFPRARVIFTHRDGRDTALSVFMRQFAEPVAFATDLLDAGRRWRESERIAAYWARCLPLPMHDVQYETLIDDFETEARRLIDFLGLPWEPACLEFHKTERAVRTESLWQVRQPLYDRSVGRWRHYAKHLRPLCDVVGVDPDAPTGARPVQDGRSPPGLG